MSLSIDDLKIGQREYLEKLKTIIVTGLKNQNDKIKIKYKWMKDKYLIFLNRLVNVRNGPSSDFLFHQLTIEDINGIRKIFYDEIKNIQ
jgi:hypothetical protein